MDLSPTSQLNGAAAIVGVGETRIGRVPDQGSFQMYVESISAALGDAGLSRADVDILITASSRTDPHLYHCQYVAEYMGMLPKHCITLQTGGASTVGALTFVVSMIASGAAEVAVVAAADNVATGMTTTGVMTSMSEGGSNPNFEVPFGILIPGMYAMIARRHMHEYGTTREQMAAVAVAARKHAALTEKAQKKDPITIEDVLASKPIAKPFNLLDCCLLSDGGGAFVVASSRLARLLPHPPAYILGIAEAHRWEHLSQASDVTTTAAVESGRRAFAMAGVRPVDIDTAVLYDAFTILPIMFLEDLGFCAKGEGGPFVEGGRIELGGELPVNTHGGLLSYCHPGRSGAIFGLIEAVRQVRGECGERQVPDTEVVLVHNEGGIASTNATLVLATEAS